MTHLSATPEQQAREAAQLEHLGRNPEAIRAYRDLLARHPALPDCWYNLARLERREREYEAALASYARALEHHVAQPEEVHLNRAVIFTDYLRQDAAAEHELRTALALNPRYLPALQNLGNLYEDLGRREDALRTYARLLEQQPAHFEVLARFAQLAGGRNPDEALIGRLRAALAHPAATAVDRASVGFALAALEDARGAYAAAFAAAQAANRASRDSAGAGVGYDRLAQEQLVDAVIRAFPGSGPRRRDLAATGPQPLFICGMFRSGSTLAEQILTGHPGVRSGGELDLLPHLVQAHFSPFPAAMARVNEHELDAAAARYLAELAAVFPGALKVTDKRPDNFLLIGLIRSLFPQARIVHTRRDALDTALSIFFLHLDHRLSYALDLMDIGHYFRQYRRLMDHWHALYPGDILEFDYDALVLDPRTQAQRLLAFCGLDWDESCLEISRRAASVKTASTWQVREPLYRRSSGRSRNYRAELAALASYLSQDRPR